MWSRLLNPVFNLITTSSYTICLIVCIFSHLASVCGFKTGKYTSFSVLIYALLEALL